MAKSLLHVMFSCSAAGGLRACLADLGRSERVIAPRDDFSFGPIRDPSDPSRSQWVEDVLGINEWDDLVKENASFISSSHVESTYLVAWFSRRSTSEYAGFLWWLSQLGDRPFKVIDVTGFPCSGRGAAATGMLSRADYKVLIGSERTLLEDEASHHRATWRRLQKENAPFRVIGASGRLESAMINHFDALILSCITIEWRKMARVVGDALATFRENGLYQTGDLVLYARTYDLAESHCFEWRGDLANMQKCELRFAPVCPP